MIIGHKIQQELLKMVSLSSKRPQALLFTGEESLGKKKVAMEFIKLINCIQENNPCGNCISCTLIEKQTHPDIIMVSPEKKEIGIGQIRDLQHQLILTPHFVSQKVVIIDNAETLNAEAQNCLLKTLEEPPGDAIFILLTHLPEVLFGTIRSRCEVLKFYPVSKEELRNGLSEKESLNNFEDVITQCYGRPGIAVNLFEDKKFFEQRKKRKEIVQKLFKSELSNRFAFSKKFFVKDTTTKESELLLEDFTRYMRGMLLSKIGVKQDEPYTEDLEKYSISELKQGLRLISDLKFLLLSTNINQRLGFENLMLNI